MKIIVPVKRVIDPYAKVRPLPDGSGIDTTSLKFEVNPFDEIALEEAVRIKERSGAEVIAVSIGGAECEEQLRKALAIGADRAILLETTEVYDPLGIAIELAAVAASESADVILMGKQSTDGDNNQVGQMLAAKLGWPQATYACKVEVGGSSLKVTRETDTGEETLELPLPCLVTTDLRLNEPRYIALPGIIKARSKPLERRPPSRPSQPKTRVVKVESTPPRPPGRKVGSVDELIGALKDRGVLA